ncbi:MAG TPA: D-glycero-beta-D-manno-heptose 1,7-bisphosphate 7-phosphatase [Burkholderiaceae bacterium]|nr:D-glycero-beta-D-manno-heptose 1,7-bisphosphate 7-phosphatase [Burkholderiaceae bacterium]
MPERPRTPSPRDAAPRRAAFLDRDGVINVDHGYVWRQEDFDFVPGVLQAAAALHERGYLLVVATNQSGIGRGRYSEAQFHALTGWMRERFAAAGAPLAGVYFCPHHPTDAVGAYRTPCPCRKPEPGMLLAAARDLDLDLSRSVFFGDTANDLVAARAAGIPARVLLGKDGAAIPPAPAERGLATALYRDLAAAVCAGDFGSIEPARHGAARCGIESADD